MEHMAVFDTNILIDLFNNRVEAADAIEHTASHRAISLITPDGSNGGRSQAWS